MVKHFKLSLFLLASKNAMHTTLNFIHYLVDLCVKEIDHR